MNIYFGIICIIRIICIIFISFIFNIFSVNTKIIFAEQKILHFRFKYRNVHIVHVNAMWCLNQSITISKILYATASTYVEFERGICTTRGECCKVFSTTL